MKTRKRKIEIGIVSDVANFRRKIIIGLATLLMGIFVLPASAPVSYTHLTLPTNSLV